ncbi:MAG: aldose 1-epimerase [Saprospiraceae bacterium]
MTEYRNRTTQTKQMYKQQKEQFGAFDKLTFFNETSGNGFSVVPEVGGTILEIWLKGESVLAGCVSPEELENNQDYKSALLFPFPNRLKDGKYQLNGRDYQFPINNALTDNALHGLGREVKMDVLASEVTTSQASITLSYFNEGIDKAYPFAFLFDVVFSMSEETGFEVKMKFTNEANENIPVGIGWHPYFKIGDTVEGLNLKIPDCKMIEIDERMIPTGTLLDYDYFDKPRMIGKAVLDNGFKLSNEQGRKEVLLADQNFTLKYWQETGSGKFNFLQIYTPPSRTCIAIEPMTCNIDAFNNRDGLLLLAPEESVEAACGIQLEG